MNHLNRKMIAYVLGWVLIIESALMILPMIVSLFYQEYRGIYFLISAALCLVTGYLLCRKKPTSTVFYLKEGCFATALSWIIMSVFGALPFVLSGQIPSFVDALFETISGFTTTGASILTAVEPLDKCMLFWRSFTHWVGGMGVLVFLLAIVPMTGASHMNLMRAESPGPSVDKLVPKVKLTAQILYGIYFALTVLEVIILLIGKMPLFDALTSAFGTAGTGGFGIKNDSFGSYTAFQQWVVTIFMALFGVNFNAYYYILYRKFKKAFAMEEVRWYFMIILIAIVAIMFNTYDAAQTFEWNLRHVSFTVSSIITTTGFATVDFNQWAQFSRTILVVLMFIGACAGSTGGGIKVSRFLIGNKAIAKELNSYLHPKAVVKVRMDDKPVDGDICRAVNIYFLSFLIIFTISVLLISIENFDMVTNFTAVAATINNIGPGLEIVGPTGNFHAFSSFSKCVLMIDMLAGRLELYPMLILFYPPFLKQLFARNK